MYKGLHGPPRRQLPELAVEHEQAGVAMSVSPFVRVCTHMSRTKTTMMEMVTMRCWYILQVTATSSASALSEGGPFRRTV